MIFVAQALCYDLEELLRVLLLPADARTKSVLEGAYEGLRRDGFLVYGPLVQLVQDVLEAIREQTLLQTLQLPRPRGRVLLTRLVRINKVDFGPVELPAVRLPDQVQAQVRQAGQGLQDRVDETVVGGIAQPNDALLLGAGARGLVVQERRNVQVRRLYPPLLSDNCTVTGAVITCLLGEAAAAK